MPKRRRKANHQQHKQRSHSLLYGTDDAHARRRPSRSWRDRPHRTRTTRRGRSSPTPRHTPTWWASSTTMPPTKDYQRPKTGPRAIESAMAATTRIDRQTKKGTHQPERPKAWRQRPERTKPIWEIGSRAPGRDNYRQLSDIIANGPHWLPYRERENQDRDGPT